MTHTMIHPSDVLNTIRQHWRLVITPVIVLTVAALGYALVRPDTWEASQALIVRDETGDNLTRPGKFAHPEDMKSTQETILELAKSRGVLDSALRIVGPGDQDELTGKWPTTGALEALQDSVEVSPPKGAEFGKTEVFYLKVRDRSRSRAVALASAICAQLQHRMAALREATAKSTTEELTHSALLAKQDLDQATASLAKVEQRVGNDLAELRILSNSPSGDSDLRRNLVELKKELRTYSAAQVENEELLKLLKAAEVNPDRLLASPGSLLNSQPALRRLKEGLVDAQLRSGQALGTMSEDHPQVKGAREAEHVIRDQLHDEISLAIRGAEADLHIGTDRIRSVEDEIADIQSRLSSLVTLRAEYANLSTAVQNRSETLKNVEHELAEARASEAAARASSRISPIDQPDAGTRPMGPGRMTIVAAGFGSGLLVSAAIVFLLTQPAAGASARGFPAASRASSARGAAGRCRCHLGTGGCHHQDRHDSTAQAIRTGRQRATYVDQGLATRGQLVDFLRVTENDRHGLRRYHPSPGTHQLRSTAVAGVCRQRSDLRRIGCLGAAGFGNGDRRSIVRPVEDPPISLALERFRRGEPLTEPLGNQSRLYTAAKRSFDFVGAALLIVLLSPLLLAITAVLAITTRGRPFFAQERIGYCGRRFRMFKFRTMRLDADKVQHLVANEKDGPIFKNRRDPRVTRIGRLLRITSIDELPQLFNVLGGSMSLVGPRPPVAREVEQYEPWQRRRLAVKPGLTCLWQVSGRSEVAFEDWVRMDLWYLKNQNLATDAKLLAKTPASVVSGRGAY